MSIPANFYDQLFAAGEKPVKVGETMFGAVRTTSPLSDNTAADGAFVYVANLKERARKDAVTGWVVTLSVRHTDAKKAARIVAQAYQDNGLCRFSVPQFAFACFDETTEHFTAGSAYKKITLIDTGEHLTAWQAALQQIEVGLLNAGIGAGPMPYGAQKITGSAYASHAFYNIGGAAPTMNPFENLSVAARSPMTAGQQFIFGYLQEGLKTDVYHIAARTDEETNEPRILVRLNSQITRENFVALSRLGLAQEQIKRERITGRFDQLVIPFNELPEPVRQAHDFFNAAKEKGIIFSEPRLYVQNEVTYFSFTVGETESRDPFVEHGFVADKNDIKRRGAPAGGMRTLVIEAGKVSVEGKFGGDYINPDHTMTGIRRPAGGASIAARGAAAAPHA